MSIITDVAADPGVAKVEIVDITIRKHNGTFEMSLMPQFISLNIYQSITQSLMSADITINDPISLHVNYPIVGEEIIKVVLKPTRYDPYDSRNEDREGNYADKVRITMEFMVSEVVQMHPDDKTRASIYSLKLFSLPMYYNVKWRVQRAFKGQYHEIVKDILRDYLRVDNGVKPELPTGLEKIKDSNFEASRGDIAFVVPNLKPLQAINWCAKRAVPEDNNNNLYMFFENFDGFHFKTVQHMMKDKVDLKTGLPTRNTHKFIWISNITSQVRRMINEKSLDAHLINAMSINKRYHTTEKFITGFYENEYYEIDITNKRVNNKQTTIKDAPENTLDKYQLNTPQYLRDSKINNDRPGTKTRVRYKIGQNGGDDPSKSTYYSDKFGEAVRASAALSQIFMTIAVPGHTAVQAGDIVQIELPEMHGFEKIVEDAYVSGTYIITDIKHSINAGETHNMTLNLARDSYATEIEQKTRYNIG